MQDPEVEIILDSVNSCGNRLTTFQVSFPKCLLAELNTHRSFSKNAGSSRAKPSKVLRDSIRQKSFHPIKWEANKPGMQSEKELPWLPKQVARFAWGLHKYSSLFCNWLLSDVAGVHKQYANRVLETHAFVDIVVSGTEWNNFFSLRCHPDAQPEFKAIAEEMQKQYKASVPQQLEAGQWHLPYVTKEDIFEDSNILNTIKISIARCARVSYKTFDDLMKDRQKDYALCHKLFGSQPMHLSPTEHVALALDTPERFGNFVGFKQYRKTIQGENGNDYLELKT